MDTSGRQIDRIHERYAPVDQRVEEVLAGIRRACVIPKGESYNRANERQVEEFIAWLKDAFRDGAYEVTRVGGSGEEDRAWAAARARAQPPCVVIERQRLSTWALRTTRWNYVFTVPGDSEECVVLVAHYDTWRGPGADDNTTGEEIVKQYRLADVRAPRRPALTHTYFLAGSEECGLVGLMSQLLLAMGLQAANFALSQQSWGWMLAALATAPLASYRFGVSGSREYVRSLRESELRRIRAVVSVDSVGEGRLYIPRGTMGADFLHVLIPFGDYDSLNDLLEEAAHLHGIKYNNFLAGGTTDHVSFLEVNNGLWHRVLDMVRRAAHALGGGRAEPPLRIPATALVAMLPGKASPVVFGGKIHTPRDVPARVYPGPLRETFLILDYLFFRLEGGPRLREPRDLDEFHYARLYRSNGEYLLALKDAVEPNRRNLNAVYRAEAVVDGTRATVRPAEILGWGVEPRLKDEVVEMYTDRGKAWTGERVRIDDLEVEHDGRHLRFARRLTPWLRLAKWYHRGVAALQGILRRFFFFSFFALAYLLSQVVGWAFDLAFALSAGFARWFAEHVALTFTVVIVLEIAILLYMMARRIPTWIDNTYRHVSRADNLGSLRRVPAAPPDG